MSEKRNESTAKTFPLISPTTDAYRSRGSLPIPSSVQQAAKTFTNSQFDLNKQLEKDEDKQRRKKPSKYHRSSGTINILPTHDHDEDHSSILSFENNEEETSSIQSVDSNVEVVTRKPPTIKPTQNIFTKYLKPTPLKPPGDLVLKQEPDQQLPPLSPLHIIEPVSDDVKAKVKPPPIIVRDRPMQKPKPIPEQRINIPGKVLPAPDRQLIIERLASPPTPPPDIIYEKWLPYEELPPRRVVYIPPPPFKPLTPKPNILIKWEKPEMNISKSYNHLGTEVVDPDLYVAEHCLDFIESSKSYHVPNLIGDVKYLSLIDLDKCGLSEYKEQVNRFLAN